MSKPKPTWPLGLSLGDLDADRVAKPTKRPADAKKVASPKLGVAASRLVSVTGVGSVTEPPSVRRNIAAARRLLPRPAITPDV